MTSHIAFIGVDGRGKSSCCEALPVKLAATAQAGGIGEKVRIKTLMVIPEGDRGYCLNVDGLLKRVRGKIEYSLFLKVKLLTA